MDNDLVRRARAAFEASDYSLAKSLYQQAEDKYGEGFFKANLVICENRIKRQSRVDESDDVAKEGKPRHRIEQQLSDTQALLEHYYRRCQEFEYQLG